MTANIHDRRIARVVVGVVTGVVVLTLLGISVWIFAVVAALAAACLVILYLVISRLGLANISPSPTRDRTRRHSKPR